MALIKDPAEYVARYFLVEHWPGRVPFITAVTNAKGTVSLYDTMANAGASILLFHPGSLIRQIMVPTEMAGRALTIPQLWAYGREEGNRTLDIPVLYGMACDIPLPAITAVAPPDVSGKRRIKVRKR